MKSVLGFCLTLGMAGLAGAQETSLSDLNSTTAPLQQVAPSTPSRADIDQEITNARLRASTGSKSLLSIQSTFNYNGSSINTPLAEDRPVLSPGTVENDPAKLQGLISAKYRVSDHDNVNLGVGVGWLTPTYDGQKGQVEDPYFGYSRVFKAGSTQNVLNTQITKYTADSSVAQGLAYESDIDHTILTHIGKSKLQVGVDVAWTREFYTGAPSPTGIQDELAAYPFVEYEFTPRYSFRTVYRGFTYFNTVGSAGSFTQDAITESLGIGIAVTRDIYFYPNVQWVWTAMESERTNVALQANINVF